MLDPKEPVKVYWIMYNVDDKHEEGLNFMERKMAYGMSTAPKEGAPGHHIVTLNALTKRPIEVWCDADGTLHAIGSVEGAPVEFIRVYIEVKSGWTGPSVVRVDLYGRDMKSGKDCKESIKP